MQTQPTQSFLPIDRYPVAWALRLPELLGEIKYRFDGSNQFLPRQWLGIVSSHDLKLGYASADWQASLQSALHLAQRQGWGILCAAKAPYSESIIHACRRMCIPSLELLVLNPQTRLQHATTINQVSQICFRGQLAIYVDSQDSNPIPLHDRCVVFLAEHLFALNVRQGGKIEKLLKARLANAELPAASTYISLRATPVSFSVAKQPDLLKRGAVGWLTIDRSDMRACSSQTIQSTWQPILPLRFLVGMSERYLVHCTRSRRGPWPDQSLSQFHDELLHSPWSQYPQVIDTLHRILEQKRLVATRNFRRGNIDTVCFSEVPVEQLLSMRRFQSHVSRWDWEPYGIMIDREWLVAHGVKQVQYIKREYAKELGEEELAYSQIVSSDPNSQDWRAEKEWRLPGDLRLNQIPFSKAFVFVPTIAEAVGLQQLSRWPIAVCEND